jgi:hypothetical protein
LLARVQIPVVGQTVLRRSKKVRSREGMKANRRVGK